VVLSWRREWLLFKVIVVVLVMVEIGGAEDDEIGHFVLCRNFFRHYPSNALVVLSLRGALMYYNKFKPLLATIEGPVVPTDTKNGAHQSRTSPASQTNSTLHITNLPQAIISILIPAIPPINDIPRYNHLPNPNTRTQTPSFPPF
jgi:hypothetical protein